MAPGVGCERIDAPAAPQMRRSLLARFPYSDGVGGRIR